MLKFVASHLEEYIGMLCDFGVSWKKVYWEFERRGNLANWTKLTKGHFEF